MDEHTLYETLEYYNSKEVRALLFSSFLYLFVNFSLLKKKSWSG